MTTNANNTDAANAPAKPQLAPAPKMLAGLMDLLAQYLSCEDYQYIVLTLWIMHTWCYRAAAFTPYLNIQAPGSRHGKTRCLQLLELLCPPGAWFTSAPPPTMFRRRMLALKPADADDAVPKQDLPSVVLLDDREATLGASDSGGVVSLLKTGTMSSGRYTASFDSTRFLDFTVFCPKALAGNSALPRALQERSIPFLLQRPARGEHPVKNFDPGYARAQARPFVEWLQLWSQQNLEYLSLRTYSTPELLPDGLSADRLDYMTPLIRICEAIGDPWHLTGRKAITDIFYQSRLKDIAADVSTDTRLLLADLNHAFTALRPQSAGHPLTKLTLKTPAYIPSRDLIAYLQAMEDRPWCRWGRSPAHTLARMLRPFGLTSCDHRVSPTSTVKAYSHEEFLEVWERYS
jgi:hypothetical protein